MADGVETLLLSLSTAAAAWAAWSAQRAAKAAVENIWVARDAARAARASAEASSRSAEAAQEANVLQREVLDQEFRPRIAIEGIVHTSGLTWNETEGRLKFTITLRNVGRAPAQRVSIDAEIHGDFFDPFHEAQRRVADRARLSGGKIGITLAPGEVDERSVILPIPRAKLAEWSAKLEREAEVGSEPIEWFTPHLIGAVSYVGQDRTRVFISGFVRQIVRGDARPPGYSTAFKPSLGDLPQNAIAVGRHPFFDGAAD